MNALIVYRVRSYPMRAAIRDHLYSFRRHSAHRYTYLNLSVREVPRRIARAEFDAIVFHTTFLSARWNPPVWEEMMRRAEPLKGCGGVRVALPQDEFLRTRQVSDFIEDFGVDAVCSVAPESEWPKIYPEVDRERVRFRRVLTGYLDGRSVARMNRIARSTQRTLDIGYRARRHKPWLGRHGVIKGEIADVFGEAARDRDLAVDLSTDNDDVLLGDDWFRFLASSRYTIGAEGGASILDRDGSLMEATERYLGEHPGAAFDAVEADCFPGRDGELALYAISPRHLEACATRTCQILVEGDYNGVLRAGEHYLPLREDLSNLDEVLEAVERDEERERMVESAYRDVVASGEWTYERFVAQVEEACLAGGPSRGRARSGLPPGYPTALDLASWSKLTVRPRAISAWLWLYNTARRVAPRPLWRLLQRLAGTTSGRTRGS